MRSFTGGSSNATSMARACTVKPPPLVLHAKSVGEDDFPISEDRREKVPQAMGGVVNEGGTAAGAKLEGIEFSGKSGSAQVIGYSTRDKVGKQKRFKDNAWFVGYAPRRNPEIVVAVLVEEGEHGGAAGGPSARDVVKTYYEKKTRKEQGQYTVEFQRYAPGSEGKGIPRGA